MFIDVKAIGFSLTDAIRTHVESRVSSALRPFARGVVTVTARLENVNAGRGGVDKRCSLVAAVRRRATVVTEAMDENLYVAVDKATARARRSVWRVLTRHIGRERKDPQRPGALMRPAFYSRSGRRTRGWERGDDQSRLGNFTRNRMLSIR